MRGRLSFGHIFHNRPSAIFEKDVSHEEKSVFYSVIVLNFVFHIKTYFRLGNTIIPKGSHKSR